jgi:predicted O-methyltransferase YrrM
MDLTNSQRVGKVIRNLVDNPDLLVPYLRMSILNRRLPIDLGLPWWSFRAIKQADHLLVGKRIFEYGTGGSTLRFAKIATEIVSVEDDPEWLEVVRKRLRREKIFNVELRFHPFDFRHPINFESSDYIGAVDTSEWDVVIIDGQDWTFKERLACFRRAEPKMKSGSIIILDDFWRYTELLASNRAQSVEVYESVGPSRLGVTSTAFFHY